jgi:hypothetical protein
MGLTGRAIQTNDSVLAQECYEALKDDPSTMLYPHYWFGSIKGRLLGLLKLTLKDADSAVGYFDECYHFARALLLRGPNGDTAVAPQMLGEGLAIAIELGMKPVEGKIAALL